MKPENQTNCRAFYRKMIAIGLVTMGVFPLAHGKLLEHTGRPSENELLPEKDPQ